MTDPDAPLPRRLPMEGRLGEHHMLTFVNARSSASHLSKWNDRRSFTDQWNHLPSLWAIDGVLTHDQARFRGEFERIPMHMRILDDRARELDNAGALYNEAAENFAYKFAGPPWAFSAKAAAIADRHSCLDDSSRSKKPAAAICWRSRNFSPGRVRLNATPPPGWGGPASSKIAQ
jgi:hypothetical protein